MVTRSSKLVQVFGALGDSTREAIVEQLAGGPQPVHRLASGFPVSRPAISRHLRLLKEAGIVGERRRGRERIYFLRHEALAPVAEWAVAMNKAGGAEIGGVAVGGAAAGGPEAGGALIGAPKAAGRGGGTAPVRKKAAKRRLRRSGVAAKGGARPVERAEASSGAADPAGDDWKTW